MFDEVQECPEIITSLKFWTICEKYDVIATGSALGMDYNIPASYPVGYVETKKMYSLDFEEFLWANGIDEQKIQIVRDYYEQLKELPIVIHQEMMKWLRLYMVIGGMPEVVNRYMNYPT